MRYVKPKKHLGQHFLKDKSIAERIVKTLIETESSLPVLEIGPGTGVLTSILVEKLTAPFKVVEIDSESVVYLKEELGMKEEQIIEADFLRSDFSVFFSDKFNIIGNFPYNISSQIFFKMLENKNKIDQVTCMLQKEVADRITATSGGRVSGILTILIQAFYDTEFNFIVPPNVFLPPPKVDSAVITLKRNNTKELDCNEKFFFRVVKQAFSTRRKTLRNALKLFQLPTEITSDEVFSKRAEQLSVSDFVELTKIIEEHSKH
ncbi:16S rRNA (adenine(1518)-N(6)/adenine(1519)-N(6))-dimethyltransferase RsmA [Chondrinema litorale]|uniref:16S rRNA (adenine(1518)-N(6)/adenine(1519)-N(6))- dimethyltransferase RsmA n=1 Tax=Chondrinema litorale TaxID=2994555 RepID=UPI0025446589|nr:16S rRNA (adenine(1518)-N(6)/adenine(1519)-N(6))-dimethyltransferase RsmA [Chondrinema litorale]UZR94883.1 16S rRNA (adenine(1518)-N(6)/adenine(1519)-N(6))-dimethyltransferase RsmA [Chondrinema litorale]